MDFNLRSKFWAGNLYHQSESICQDVDEFVGKDTVRFVETQVQNVGVTVKNLYSNVVQDILPLPRNIVKPKQQLVDNEQVDMRDHVSVTGVRANSTCINEKQLFLSQGSVHTLRNSDASLPIEFDHIMHKPPSTDSSQEVETCLHLREHGDAITQYGEASGVEDNIQRDLVQVTVNPSSDNEMFSGTPDEDHKDSTLTLSSSPAFSAHDEGLTTIKNERGAFNREEGNKGFSDDTGCLSDISRIGQSLESKLPMVEEPCSYDNGSLSLPPVASAHKVDEENILLMDSLFPSVCDADTRDFNAKALCDSHSFKDEGFDASTSDQSSEHVSSFFSCNEKEEMGVTPSSCCTSPKCYSIMESTSEDFIEKDENILRSHDKNACQTEFPIGSSESRHGQKYKNVYSEIVISPSEAGNTCEVGVRIGDLDLDTVNNVTHYGKSVILNSNLVRAASHRRRNLGYYKKLIQDTLTSRKRLSKEYEHLAILYRDIDMESSQNFEASSLPIFTNLAVNAARTQTSMEMSETDWELL